MPSRALAGLEKGLDEVRSLRKLSPVRDIIARGAKADTARAHGRASVVLLSGHYERYIKAVNEEALQWLVTKATSSSQIPEQIKLRHSRASLETLAATKWEKRAKGLISFASIDSLLWDDSTMPPQLDHAKVLRLKAPHSKEVSKFYAMYGIDDIFRSITRSQSRRNHLRLKLQEMVDKRNNIAHGDFTTEALPSEIMSYVHSVNDFCKSADRVFSNRLKKMTRNARKPW